MRDIWTGVAIITMLIGFFIWEHNYEKNTLNMSERLETVEGVADSAFQNVQKLNCFEMYGDDCEEIDYLVVPPYKGDNWVEERAVEVIKSHESFSASEYPDECLWRDWDGKCGQYQMRIGYGTKIRIPGEVITEEEATLRLKEHLRSEVIPYIPDNVTDKGVKIALMDIGYNAGPSAIRDCVNIDGSLNIENYQKWTRAGKDKDVLERRRRSTLIYVLSIMED